MKIYFFSPLISEFDDTKKGYPKDFMYFPGRCGGWHRRQTHSLPLRIIIRIARVAGADEPAIGQALYGFDDRHVFHRLQPMPFVCQCLPHLRTERRFFYHKG